MPNTAAYGASSRADSHGRITAVFRLNSDAATVRHRKAMRFVLARKQAAKK